MKRVSYVLLAIVLVLGVVFFVQSQNSNEEVSVEGVMETDLGDAMSGDGTETRMAGEPVMVPDGDYKVDTASSVVRWLGEKKIVPSSHEGTVGIKSGSFSVVDGLIVSGEVVVDMESIALSESDTGGDMLIGHLRSDDFFSVANYPEATLRVLDVNGTADEQEISGELTIKGNTRAVVFGLAPAFGPADQPALTGKMTIDRSEFDVRFGSESFFDDLGDGVIKNEMVLDFLLVGTSMAADLE